jgi:S-adenosylmethionine-dependent methyltransferase
MPDITGGVRAYYDDPRCGEDSRLARHQLERDITVRYLEAYLPGTGRVLEIGAATGGYTAWLAGRGYEVTAVDLSRNLIEQCQRRLFDLGLARKVHCLVADALDLSPVPGVDFDAVLLMGPLYHLTRRENRLKALREAAGRLKPGGVLFSSMISRFGILGDLLRNGPQWIENREEVRSVIERGHDPEQTGKIGFHGYFGTADEIAPLHEKVGLETLVVAGVEPAISGHDEDYNSLEGTRRELWLDLLYELSREPSLVASSRHMLYVGRKPRDP